MRVKLAKREVLPREWPVIGAEKTMIMIYVSYDRIQCLYQSHPLR
jgi:hypothetical protein